MKIILNAVKIFLNKHTEVQYAHRLPAEAPLSVTARTKSQSDTPALVIQSLEPLMTLFNSTCQLNCGD